MCHDFRCQRLIRNVLVVAASDQNDLLVKAAQTGNGARRAGADGVVVVQHAVQRAHRLNAVLHTGKGAAHLLDGFHGHLAPHSSQQVFNVVQAAQLHVLLGQEGGHNAILGHAEHVVLLAQEGTVVGIVQAGEPHLLALAVGLHGTADLVLIAQHSAAGLLLVQQDVALGINVLLHVLVVVQMVGGDIGHHGNVGAGMHADELEAGKLHHSHILGSHLGQHGQQSCADVAAQMHLTACGLVELGDQGSGGGLRSRRGRSRRTTPPHW